MLQPEQYQNARRTAEFHGQVRILKVEIPKRTPAHVLVQAEIVHTFRGPTTYAPGAFVRFRVSVLKGDEPLDRIPIGGTIWKNLNDLVGAEFIEVFLNGEPPDCEVDLWQSAIISEPSSSPDLDSGNVTLGRELRWPSWLRDCGVSWRIFSFWRR
jgi:hypothetical protein